MAQDIATSENTIDSDALEIESDTSATATPPIPIVRYTPNVRKNQEQLFTQAIGEGTVQWLNDGNQDFISLWEHERSGKPFGAILLIHGEGQTADWPYTIRALRLSLPDHGWATLSIAVPEPEIAIAPPRAQPDKAIEPAPTNLIETTKSEVTARLASAMSYLNSKGQFNIVILSHGVGAAHALNFIAELSGSRATQVPADNAKRNTRGMVDKPVRAFIMVNARNGAVNAPNNLIQNMNDPALPMLDVYFGDHVLDQTEPKLRKQAAKKNRVEAFHQVKLMAPSANWQQGENRLTRRVRGFLNKYAKGVEIDG